jgi:hypothetical protein
VQAEATKSYRFSGSAEFNRRMKMTSEIHRIVAAALRTFGRLIMDQRPGIDVMWSNVPLD